MMNGVDTAGIDSVRNSAESRFTLWALRKTDTQPLLQLGVSWDRLMNDVVTPYDTGESFFLDGAPIRATDVDRLKILIQGPGFQQASAMINWNLRNGDVKRRELYSMQYHVFIEALLREHCTDVTSQVVSAFRTAIKPRLD